MEFILDEIDRMWVYEVDLALPAVSAELLIKSTVPYRSASALVSLSLASRGDTLKGSVIFEYCRKL